MPLGFGSSGSRPPSAVNALMRSAKNGHRCLHRRHLTHDRYLLADPAGCAVVAVPATSSRRAACCHGLARDLPSCESTDVDRFGSAAGLFAPKSLAPRADNPVPNLNRLRADDASDNAIGRDRQFVRTDAKPRTPLGAIVAAVWPSRFRIRLMGACVPLGSTRSALDFLDPSSCPAWTHLLQASATSFVRPKQGVPHSPPLPSSAGIGVLVS
jgi:hypothetical protein